MDIAISFILCGMYEPMVAEAGFRSSFHLKPVVTGTMLSVHGLLRNRVLLGPSLPVPCVTRELAHTGSEKVWQITGKAGPAFWQEAQLISSNFTERKGEQEPGKGLETAYWSEWRTLWPRIPSPESLGRLFRPTSHLPITKCKKGANS